MFPRNKIEELKKELELSGVFSAVYFISNGIFCLKQYFSRLLFLLCSLEFEILLLISKKVYFIKNFFSAFRDVFERIVSSSESAPNRRLQQSPPQEMAAVRSAVVLSGATGDAEGGGARRSSRSDRL